MVDEAGDGTDPSSRGQSTPTPEEDFDLGADNVHDLDDAPAAPTGGLDALTEAFPGSELVDGK